MVRKSGDPKNISKLVSHLPEISLKYIQELASFIDLDGNLLIRKDPFGGLSMYNGGWNMTYGGGLGITEH